MNRREFVSGVVFGLLAAPLAAGAQPAGKVWRIGLLHVGLDHVPPSLDGLREGLRALGYEEGKNIRLDWRNLPDEDAAHKTAKEFVQDRVDLLVAFENQTVRAARAATSDVPIVFLHVSDPVVDGFVTSLARPGRNLTGIADADSDLHAKQLETFKELVPQLRRLLVVMEPHDPVTRRLLAELREAARSLKVQLLEHEVTERADIEGVFGGLKRGDVQGVFILSPTLKTKFPSLFLRLATKNQLPILFHRKEWVIQGGLFSYGYNFLSVGRTAATYVDKILKGAKPADLPIEQPTKFELVINAKTAKALGLTIPPSLLLRADQLIQ
jgi:putative tryptophan/tyrosine transport system substrate-binding protein